MNSKLLFIIVLFAVSIFISGCASKNDIPSGKYDSFAKCLTEKNITMYGTSWCPHCKDQKEMFGDSVQYIDFVDCDESKEVCLNLDIPGYPTWVINGEQYPGTQTFYDLAKLSGCSIN